MLRKQILKKDVTYTLAQSQLTHTHTHTQHTYTHTLKIIGMLKRPNSYPVSGQVTYMYTRCISPEVEVHVGWLALENFTLSTLHDHA